MDIPKPDGPDVSIALHMLVSCWIMYGIALVVLCGRLLAKLRISARLAIDDVLMIISMISGLLYFSLATVGVTYGIGRHFYYLAPFERVNAMKFQFISEPVGILTPMFGRISFCFYLLNLIGPSKPRRWFLYGVMIQHFIITILTIVLIVAQCPNFATMWDPMGHPGACWSRAVQADFGYFQGATNAVTDIILTVMPAFIVWKLQIARKLKIGLTFLLGLSVFAVAGEIVRTTLTSKIADRLDFTYNIVDFIIWCSVENCIVIIASSVPMLRSLFVRQKPHKSSYEMHSSDYPSRGQTKGTGIKSQITSRGYPGPDSSEENILPVQGKAAIAKSMSYTVAYEITPESKG